jgi:hypothetical protein
MSSSFVLFVRFVVISVFLWLGLGRAECGYIENWLLSISETNILMS